MHGIEFYAGSILAGLHRRDCAATHADAIVVTTHHHNSFTCFGSSLDSVFGCCIAYTSGKHDHLVVGIHFAVFIVLECQEGAADEGLTELVAEIRSAVRGFDEDFGGSLIKPGARVHHKFPRVVSEPGI